MIFDKEIESNTLVLAAASCNFSSVQQRCFTKKSSICLIIGDTQQTGLHTKPRNTGTELVNLGEIDLIQSHICVCLYICVYIYIYYIILI